jgi:hypothetical protein
VMGGGWWGVSCLGWEDDLRWEMGRVVVVTLAIP